MPVGYEIGINNYLIKTVNIEQLIAFMILK